LDTLKIWVSTGIDGLPKENNSTQATVFGPTPLNFKRYLWTSSASILARKLRLDSPSRRWISSKRSFILWAFCWERPPSFMASAISSWGALRVSSQVGNLCVRFLKARNELCQGISPLFPAGITVFSLEELVYFLDLRGAHR